MLLDDLLLLLRSYAPESTALANDPVGLLIEPAEREVRSVVVCLDVTAYVAAMARDKGCELIIAHHPLIYHPLRRLSSSDSISSVALSLARSGMGLYAMHTNWDAAVGGINDTLAQRLGLGASRPLGAHGEAALSRIGELSQSMSATAFASHVTASLSAYPTSALRIPRALFDHSGEIRTVAVCGGAGSSLASLAREQDAQALVTADVRHHEFIDAGAHNFLLIDAGHEATEMPGMEALAQRLAGDAPELNVNLVPNWP